VYVRRATSTLGGLYPLALLAVAVVVVAYLGHWGSVMLHGK
jgi:hypothetical protein